MIKITDMTLSCISGFSPSKRQLEKLVDLLLSTGIDTIEMPAAVYDQIKPSPSARYILRIGKPDEAVNYSEIGRFICRKSGFVSDPSITYEIQINDIREMNFLGRYAGLQNIRIVGLDDVLCHDYVSAFKNIKKQIRGRIEFCPEDSFSCATASAVEWIMNGGSDIVTAFGGLAGKASLEEVLLSLRVVKRYKPGASFTMFPEIAKLLEEMIPVRFSDKKPVIGKNIFDVESGIHIDGILKKPVMYEPFLPELVGNSRKFMVGKHSGSKAIRIKLVELGLDPEEYDCAVLLCEVKKKSIEKLSSLTDEEYFLLAQKYKK